MHRYFKFSSVVFFCFSFLPFDSKYSRSFPMNSDGIADRHALNGRRRMNGTIILRALLLSSFSKVHIISRKEFYVLSLLSFVLEFLKKVFYSQFSLSKFFPEYNFLFLWLRIPTSWILFPVSNIFFLEWFLYVTAQVSQQNISHFSPPLFSNFARIGAFAGITTNISSNNFSFSYVTAPPMQPTWSFLKSTNFSWFCVNAEKLLRNCSNETTDGVPGTRRLVDSKNRTMKKESKMCTETWKGKGKNEQDKGRRFSLFCCFVCLFFSFSFALSLFSSLTDFPLLVLNEKKTSDEFSLSLFSISSPGKIEMRKKRIFACFFLFERRKFDECKVTFLSAFFPLPFKYLYCTARTKGKIFLILSLFLFFFSLSLFFFTRKQTAKIFFVRQRRENAERRS